MSKCVQAILLKFVLTLLSALPGGAVVEVSLIHQTGLVVQRLLLTSASTTIKLPSNISAVQVRLLPNALPGATPLAVSNVLPIAGVLVIGVTVNAAVPSVVLSVLQALPACPFAKVKKNPCQKKPVAPCAAPKPNPCVQKHKSFCELKQQAVIVEEDGQAGAGAVHAH